MINPLVRIILVVFVTVLLSASRGMMLSLTSLSLACAAIMLGGSDFFRFLRRARWLMFSMFFIYAFFTPGEYLPGVPDTVAPSIEGLREAGFQVMRLGATLAAISLLLGLTSREQLIAGVRQLLLPLQVFGFPADRFAVRLWLTLHYVEHWPPGLLRQLNGQDIRFINIPALRSGPDRIVLQQIRWSVVDVLALASLPVIWWWMR